MREIKKIGCGKPGRRGPALRVVADQLVAPAGRRNRRAGIRRQKPDHVLHRQLAGEIHGGAEMPGIANADGGDAVLPCPRGRQLDRMLGDLLANAVAAVKGQKRAGIGDDLRFRIKPGRAAGDACAVPEGPHHPMRGMPPQISRDKRVREMRGRYGRHIHGQIDVGDEVAQSVGINVRHG